MSEKTLQNLYYGGGGTTSLWSATKTTLHSSEKILAEIPEMILITLAETLSLILKNEVRNQKSS